MGEEGLAKDLEEASILGTTYLYTAGPASLLGGLLGDWLGRRRTILLCWPILLAGYLSLPLAPTLMWILPPRILSALGTWLAYSSGSILIAEFVHPSLRGTLCSMPSVFLAVGMLITYILGALLPWRLMSWLLLFQPPILLLLLLFIPESPQWLALQGQREKARASLIWARGTSWNCEAELEEMVGGERPPDILERLAILRSRPFLRSLAVSGGLFFLCQYTGIATLVVFMAPVLADSGLTLSPLLASVIIGSVRVATSCLSSAILRHGNRKYMFSSCSALLSICCAALAAFSHWRTDLIAISPVFGFSPLVIAIVMFIGHAFGINPVTHLISSEMFPGNARSLESSLSLTIAVFSSGINASLYPVMIKLTSFSIVFIVYAVATLVMFFL